MTPTGEMTFWDHLEDLRKCIFRILGVFALAVVVLFFFKNFPKKVTLHFTRLNFFSISLTQ